MSATVIALIVFVVGGLLLAMFVIGIFNNLVTLKNRVDNAFSQIDVQLQRRYDLIPNLVEIAKKYMAHERETLEAVIAARNSAHSAAAGAKSNPAAIGALAGAEAALGGAMMNMFALSESYPDLKADTQMTALQEELATTENRVAFARQAFNDSVTGYNIGQQRFPAVIFAGMFGHSAAEEWVVESAEVRKAVKVNFG
jgi:LemA protein